MRKFTQVLFLFPVFSITVFISDKSLAGVGFKNGNDFEAFRISGYVTAFCPNQNGAGTEVQAHVCRAEILNPGETDYFVGPKVSADKVILTARQVDGTERTKSSDYKSSAGISTSRFNLWIQTLTQRPLLDVGENNVHFVLQKSNAKVAEGDFIATVTRGSDLRCPDDTISAPFASDCLNQFTICDRYFEQNNYCQ